MLSYSGQKGFARVTPPKKQFKADIGAVAPIKQRNTVTIKTHIPTCPIMSGVMPVFNECSCNTKGMQHEDDCAILHRVECGCGGLSETVFNTALTSGLQKIADHLIDNTVDAQVKYFEWGMGSTAPTAGDTVTEVFKFRKNVVQSFRDTTNAVYKSFLNGNEGNTNIGSVVSGASTTQFTLQAGQGVQFKVGGRIEISGGAFGAPEESVIQSIGTPTADTIIVSPAFTTTATGGEAVEELISETTLWGAAAASSTEATGTPFARTTAFTPRKKTATFGTDTEWRITLV